MHALNRQFDTRLQSGISSDFRRVLTREILKTELLRIRVLIITASVMMFALWFFYVVAPDQLNKIWHGNFKAAYLYIILLPFIAVQLVALAFVKRELALDRDIPTARRYVSAFVETSIPTLALALHIDNMGSVQALGFLIPLIYFIFIILSTLRLDFWISAFTGVVASTELLAMAMYYRPDASPDFNYHLMRSVIVLVCGFLAGAVGVQLRRQFERSIAAASTRDRVTNLFGQHVSPQVVERLMAEGKGTTSDHRNVAVMFVDFRNFTAAAQSRTPQEVVDRLDGAFAELVDILDRHGGIVNKFLGDGFLALFGAPLEDPNSVHNAVASARDMIEAMSRNNAENDWELRIGIGLHFGAVVAGNIGSPRRKEYTVIGDTVNFASRIEALNKEFGSQFLVSSAVRDILGASCQDAVLLGEVAVKGYPLPMPIWRLA